MKCDWARHCIQEQLDGTLNDEEGLQEHLLTCPKCRDYQAFFQGIDKELREEVPAPRQLVKRLFPPRRPWIPVAIVAAGLLLIFAPTLVPSEPSGIETALNWLGPDIEPFE